MKVAKKILLPVFSLFLIYRSVELMRQLMHSDPADFTFSESLFIAFLLALYITGVFAFPGFAYPTSRVLPERYYALKNPPKLEWLYDFLGVKYFNVLLLFAYWGRKKNRRKYFDGTRKGFPNFIYQSRQSEFGHLGALVSIGFLSMVLLVKGYIVLFLIMTLINVIGNLYPVILQRYPRIRIEKLLARYKK